MAHKLVSYPISYVYLFVSNNGWSQEIEILD